MSTNNFWDDFSDGAEIVTAVVAPDKIFSEDAAANNVVTSLNIFHLNIRSINKNLDQLLVLLQGTQVIFDLIILSESWFLKDPEMYNINGYNMYYSGGDLNKNDGLIVYSKVNLDPETLKYKYTENTFVNLSFQYQNVNYNLTAVYRLPSTDIRIFLNEVESFLLRSVANDSLYIFVGDINLNLLDEFDNNVNLYLNLMATHGFLSYINKPTRVTHSSSTCIDHFFIKSNVHNSQINISPKILQTDITDHYAITLNISHKQVRPYIDKLNVSKKIDYEILIDITKKFCWDALYRIDDPNVAYNYFIDNLSHFIEISSKEIKVKNKHRKLKPWITTALITSIKKRDKLRMISKTNKHNVAIQREYKQYRNILNQLIKTTKSDYYSKKLNEYKGNTRKTWQILNESMNKHKIRKQIVINNNGNIVSESRQLANLFCEYYTGVGENMSKNIKKSEIRLPSSSRKIKSNNLFLYPLSEDEIVTNINKLKNSAAPGNDDISVRTLKTLCKFIAKPLVHIFDLCFQLGIFPEKLKTSVGIPIYKSGNPKSITNYRLLSIISNIAKLLEMSLKTRLCRHLAYNKLISNKQFGFREGIGTENALHEVTHTIYNNIDKGVKQLAVFLDLAKAFDSISHKILLQRLYDYGVRGVAYDIFASYLYKRPTYVKINNINSDPRTSEYSIPQGTVLGPVLFSVYINELLYIDTSAKIISYADDTVLLIQGESWQAAKQALVIEFAKISQWLNENLLTINVEKTKFMCFSIYNKHLAGYQTISLHSYECLVNNDPLNCCCQKQLSAATSVKYLGVTLDSNLKYSQHLANVNNKLRRLVYKFYQLRHIIPGNSLRILYFAFVESTLRYGIHIWGSAYPTNLELVKITQRYIIKVILSKNKRHSTALLFTEFKVLNIEQLYVLSVLRYAFKNKETLLTLNETSHDTRNKVSISYCIPLWNKTTTQRYLTYYASKFYNILPTEIKCINNLNLFSKKVKAYLIENATLFVDMLKH